MNKDKLKKAALPAVMVCLALAVIIMVAVDALKKDYDYIEKSSIAMGTVVSQKLYLSSDGDETAAGVEKAISSVEKVISRRIDSSAVSELNDSFKVKLISEYRNAFAVCNELYEKSGGAFDITTGKLSSLWNIGEENAEVPTKKSIKSALKYVDGSKVKVTSKNVEIGKGQLVDLGAVGKGLACDKVREYLNKSGVSGAVISVGGSVLLYGENPNGNNWTVAVRNPRGEINEYMGTLELESGCVSTSGDYERYLEKDGKRYHHIFDPSTGYPADSGLMSVTVVCDSGLMSDALSTACFILGREKGSRLLDAYGAQGIFISTDYSVYVTDGLKDSFTLADGGFTLAS